MKTFLELAKNRKTTYEFSDKGIKQADLRKILEAARWAPSAHNEQPWSFIVVKNKNTIEELMKYCFYGAFHSSPKVLVAVVLEEIYKNSKSLLQVEFAKLASTHQFMNIGFPCMNMILQAKSIGVDSCILSPIEEKANEILNVPSPKRTLLLVGFGYEKKGVFKKKRQRKSIREIVFNEKYGEG